MEKSNLLFNPPRLVRSPRARDLLEIFARRSLPGAIYALHPESQDDCGSFSVQRSDGTFSLRSALPGEQGAEIYLENIDLFALLELGETLSLNSQGLVYFDGKDICLKSDLLKDGRLARYPFVEKGAVLGLHAAREAIHTLWQKESGRIILSHFRRNASMKVIDGKNALPENVSYATLENKGDKSVVLATTDKNNVAGEIDFLLTLGPDGLGHPHYLEKDISLALRALDSSGERFLAPGERDGEYFFLDPRSKSVFFLREDGAVARVTGNLGGNNFLALRSVGDKCLLLQEGSLVLLDKEKELFRLNLSGELDYKNLSLAGSHAMLFTQGEREYMEIFLPE